MPSVYRTKNSGYTYHKIKFTLYRKHTMNCYNVITRINDEVRHLITFFTARLHYAFQFHSRNEVISFHGRLFLWSFLSSFLHIFIVIENFPWLVTNRKWSIDIKIDIGLWKAKNIPISSHLLIATVRYFRQLKGGLVCSAVLLLTFYTFLYSPETGNTHNSV